MKVFSTLMSWLNENKRQEKILPSIPRTTLLESIHVDAMLSQCTTLFLMDWSRLKHAKTVMKLNLVSI